MRIAAPPMALSCTKEARSMKVSEVVSQRTVIEMSGSCFDVSSVTSQIEPPKDAWAVLTRPLPTDPASSERPKDPSSAAPRRPRPAVCDRRAFGTLAHPPARKEWLSQANATPELWQSDR